mmetsp:Transcript_74190/g.135453  ORF Transcript_74190/g.135453 Transcript_74190/m.135453 type:complete len:312 (-) Transcript_74190:295-1230(-)
MSPASACEISIPRCSNFQAAMQSAFTGYEDQDCVYVVKHTFIDVMEVGEHSVFSSRRRSRSWPRGADAAIAPIPVRTRLSSQSEVSLCSSDGCDTATSSLSAESDFYSISSHSPAPSSPAPSSPAPSSTSSPKSAVAQARKSLEVVPPMEKLGSEAANEDGRQQVWWSVDAAKLRGNFTGVVSKLFDVQDSSGTPRSFIMTISPNILKKQVLDKKGVKGAASFRVANSRGIIHLKCKAEDFVGTAHFKITVGRDREDCNKELPRGPVEHDFSRNNIGGLPEGEEVWDFKKFVDAGSSSFTVCLDFFVNPQH